MVRVALSAKKFWTRLWSYSIVIADLTERNISLANNNRRNHYCFRTMCSGDMSSCRVVPSTAEATAAEAVAVRKNNKIIKHRENARYYIIIIYASGALC
jgi:hypothetical protein